MVDSLAGLDRDDYLSSDVRTLDVCLALLKGRTPGNLICVGGTFYRYSLELTEEGGSDILITARIQSLTSITSDEGVVDPNKETHQSESQYDSELDWNYNYKTQGPKPDTGASWGELPSSSPRTPKRFVSYNDSKVAPAVTSEDDTEADSRDAGDKVKRGIDTDRQGTGSQTEGGSEMEIGMAPEGPNSVPDITAKMSGVPTKNDISARRMASDMSAFRRTTDTSAPRMISDMSGLPETTTVLAPLAAPDLSVPSGMSAVPLMADMSVPRMDSDQSLPQSLPGRHMSVEDDGPPMPCDLSVPHTVPEGRMCVDEDGTMILTTTVPSVYGYSIKFLAITKVHVILQTQSMDKKNTVLYHVNRAASEDLVWLSAMTEPEVVAAISREFYVCRDTVRSPSAAWLWWPNTEALKMIELSTFVRYPERITIDPRPGGEILYYITRPIDDPGQGHLTKYDMEKEDAPIVLHSILLSCDFMKISRDSSLIIALQMYSVNFVTVCTSSMELQHSICYPQYCPLLTLPLCFPQLIITYLENELTVGIQGCIAVSSSDRIYGLDIPAKCCFHLVPLEASTGQDIAIAHVNIADPEKCSFVRFHKLIDYI